MTAAGRPLSVLHTLAYPEWTGPAEPVVALARAQQEAGCRVRLAIDNLREGDLAERVRAAGLELDERWVLSVKAGPILTMRDVLAFKRLFASDELDIVHAHRSHDHTLAALAWPGRRRRDGGPALVRTLHTARAASASRRWQLRRADGLVCVAERFRRELVERAVAEPDRVVAIEGAVDAGRFCPGSGARLRVELGIDADAPVVGIVARMHADRGHRTLLEAWEMVAARRPDARLLIAGRGELEPDLRAQVAEQPWSETVVFAGYRRDLPELYRALDLKVILAPGNDGSCRAALEAMACGVPVLAAAEDALAEIVSDGRSGRLVAPGDARALGEALCEVLQDPDCLKRWGAEARREAERRFTMERQLERVLGFYERLLGR